MGCEAGIQGKFVILRDRDKIVSYIVNTYILFKKNNKKNFDNEEKENHVF